ncbi:MAG: Hint domain-containing protein, partial [Pseudomonadota bacterium]
RGNAGEDEITISGSVVSGLVNSGSDADTVTISGSTVGNIRLSGGDDTLNFTSSSVSGSVRGGGGNDVMNLPTGTVVTDSSFGTFTISLGSSYSLSSGTFTLPSGSTVTYSSFDSGTGIPCFTRDTRIETGDGPKKVQNLQLADQLVTLHNGPQGIRWIGRRRFDLGALETNPKLRPIRIVAGALGGGLPDRDLLVSRQHRMLVQSRIAERMFGVPEVLIPAIKLIRMPGIFIDQSVTSVEYFHILLDRHEVVFAEGAPTESLFAGPEALKSIGAEERAEVLAIFPELTGMVVTPRPARYIPPNILQRRLINRHHKNNKPLLRTADIGQGQESPVRQISPI